MYKHILRTSEGLKVFGFDQKDSRQRVFQNYYRIILLSHGLEQKCIFVLQYLKFKYSDLSLVVEHKNTEVERLKKKKKIKIKRSFRSTSLEKFLKNAEEFRSAGRKRIVKIIRF